MITEGARRTMFPWPYSSILVSYDYFRRLRTRLGQVLLQVLLPAWIHQERYDVSRLDDRALPGEEPLLIPADRDDEAARRQLCLAQRHVRPGHLRFNDGFHHYCAFDQSAHTPRVVGERLPVLAHDAGSRDRSHDVLLACHGFDVDDWRPADPATGQFLQCLVQRIIGREDQDVAVHGVFYQALLSLCERNALNNRDRQHPPQVAALID